MVIKCNFMWPLELLLVAGFTKAYHAFVLNNWTQVSGAKVMQEGLTWSQYLVIAWLNSYTCTYCIVLDSHCLSLLI